MSNYLKYVYIQIFHQIPLNLHFPRKLWTFPTIWDFFIVPPRWNFILCLRFVHINHGCHATTTLQNKTSMKHPWNPQEIPINHPWNIKKSPSNNKRYLETPLQISGWPFEIFLKYFWHFLFKTFKLVLTTFLTLSVSCRVLMQETRAF